jgi:carboxymethylenebutenolidase
MKYLWIFAVLLLAACQPAAQTGTNETNTSGMEAEPLQPGSVELEGRMVEYYDGVEGYYVGSGNQPGVILIHEWWGLNTNMKQTADKLAAEGYNVLAVDLYNGEVATNQSQAQALRLAVDNEEAIANMEAAMEYLEDQGSHKIASWGYCFGGGQSANLAASGAPVDATVIYYGSVPQTQEAADQVRAPVFMVFGTEDTSTTVESAQNFQGILLSRDTPAELEIYEGVGHAFANPSNAGHDPEKTRDAWEKTIAFLDENLKGDAAPMLTGNVVEGEPDVTFDLTGENFRFMMDGDVNPTLRVKQGDHVRINLENTQGFHDWVLDEFDAATAQVWAPNATSVDFIADEAGTFEYYCSVGRHRENGMRGAFVVE